MSPPPEVPLYNVSHMQAIITHMYTKHVVHRTRDTINSSQGQLSGRNKSTKCSTPPPCWVQLVLPCNVDDHVALGRQAILLHVILHIKVTAHSKHYY